MRNFPLYLIYGAFSLLTTCDYYTAKSLLARVESGIAYRSNISCIRRKLQVTLLEVQI